MFPIEGIFFGLELSEMNDKGVRTEFFRFERIIFFCDFAKLTTSIIFDELKITVVMIDFSVSLKKIKYFNLKN